MIITIISAGAIRNDSKAAPNPKKIHANSKNLPFHFISGSFKLMDFMVKYIPEITNDKTATMTIYLKILP